MYLNTFYSSEIFQTLTFDSVFQLFLLVQWLHAAACDSRFLTVKWQRYQIFDILDLDKDAGD